MADQIPPTRLRGIDPTWREFDSQFASLLLRASCEDVAGALKRRKDVMGTVRDLLSGKRVALDDWERAVFVFQLAGQEWTQVSGPGWWLIAPDLAASLSKRLGTTVFQHLGEGMYEGPDVHLIFEAGKQIESSPDAEVEAELAASALGMYVAYDVWGDEDGRVVCMKDWDMSAFRSACLLMLKA